MARVAATPVTLTKTGYNLTDSADFTVMVLGAGNGVEFTYKSSDIVVLKNSTAGAAVYTFKVLPDTKYSAYGVTIPDDTVTVAAGKTWMRPLADLFRQVDGKVYVDCDVAGEILVLSP